MTCDICGVDSSDRDVMALAVGSESGTSCIPWYPTAARRLGDLADENLRRRNADEATRRACSPVEKWKDRYYLTQPEGEERPGGICCQRAAGGVCHEHSDDKPCCHPSTRRYARPGGRAYWICDDCERITERDGDGEPERLRQTNDILREIEDARPRREVSLANVADQCPIDCVCRKPRHQLAPPPPDYHGRALPPCITVPTPILCRLLDLISDRRDEARRALAALGRGDDALPASERLAYELAGDLARVVAEAAR